MACFSCTDDNDAAAGGNLHLLHGTNAWPGEVFRPWQSRGHSVNAEHGRAMAVRSGRALDCPERAPATYYLHGTRHLCSLVQLWEGDRQSSINRGAGRWSFALLFFCFVCTYLHVKGCWELMNGGHSRENIDRSQGAHNTHEGKSTNSQSHVLGVGGRVDVCTLQHTVSTRNTHYAAACSDDPVPPALAFW